MRYYPKFKKTSKTGFKVFEIDRPIFKKFSRKLYSKVQWRYIKKPITRGFFLNIKRYKNKIYNLIKYYHLKKNYYTKYRILKTYYYLKKKKIKKYQFLAKNKVNQFFLNLERRLDSYIFRIGYARSILHARFLITNNSFLVNNTIINYYNFLLKPGDRVTINTNNYNNLFLYDTKKLLIFLSAKKRIFSGNIFSLANDVKYMNYVIESKKNINNFYLKLKGRQKINYEKAETRTKKKLLITSWKTRNRYYKEYRNKYKKNIHKKFIKMYGKKLIVDNNVLNFTTLMFFIYFFKRIEHNLHLENYTDFSEIRKTFFIIEYYKNFYEKIQNIRLKFIKFYKKIKKIKTKNLLKIKKFFEYFYKIYKNTFYKNISYLFPFFSIFTITSIDKNKKFFIKYIKSSELYKTIKFDECFNINTFDKINFIL